MEGYMTIKETAEQWNLTIRRVQKMYADGKIEGVQKFGIAWVIPCDAKRPIDGRISTGKYKDWRQKHSSKNISYSE
ncbi:MAG: DNA-binding protein [Acetatifactor sp.]|nr:DNA-binding protein [Acetatifactor sp.]